MNTLLPPRPVEHLGHQSGTGPYRRVVFALFTAGIATFALLYSTQALLPELANGFGVTPAQSTLALSLTTASLAIAIIVVGPVSDRFGRTAFIHVSLAAAAVIAVACALAPTWQLFLALRLVEGVALAGLPSVATAYLREELHPATHARAAGLYVGGTALGGMAGRLVTAPIAEAAGWRWSMVAVAALGLGCALTVRLLLPPSRRFTAAPAGGRAALARLRGAVSDPGLLALYGIGACVVGAFVAVLNTIGFRLAGAPFHMGLTAAGMVFLVYPLGTVSSTVAGRLADKLGRRSVVPLGCMLAVFGLLLTLPATVPTVVAGLALLTAGFFIVHGVTSGWVPARAHAGGVATGQAASLYLFAYYLGSSAFGTLAAHAWSTAGWPTVVGLSLALLAVTGVLARVLHRTPPLTSGRSAQERDSVAL
ncbi:Permeases of the major facilitator superfamily [Alloactinosynnema sp. L-07]|uniref:MFS transporter n=1 Tax=Alloactinosynnema sp. L-07 TaxID=1653480 RepID=UPI00065EFDCF|nr:MFS transporter [Alloactinosynnema sp. L-07]CRK56103.1 Permeases of the major facilitator superfamily [Alloactinosynnema sp. L-07]